MTDNKDILSKALRDAVTDSSRNIPRPGDVYKHFKGDKMFIVSIGLNSDDLSAVVIYRHVDDDTVLWTRPLKEFLSLVDKKKYPDVKQKYRFEREIPIGVRETKDYQELYQMFAEHSDKLGDIDSYIIEHFYL